MGRETLQQPAAVPQSVFDGMNDEARAFVLALMRQVEQLTQRVAELRSWSVTLVLERVRWMGVMLMGLILCLVRP